MNVHRKQIGHGHLKLKYTKNKENDRYIVFDSPTKKHKSHYCCRHPRRPFFFDRAKPVEQRHLELDKKRAAFIWQWSRASQPEILIQTRLSKKSNGATEAAGIPLDHESALAATLTSENHAFLDLFGPTAGTDLLTLSEAHQSGAERVDVDVDDNHILDGDGEGPANLSSLDPKQFFRPHGKHSLSNLRRRALRANGKSPDVLEFTMYLDIFNAPRFDLGIAPVFLRCDDRR